MKIMERLDILRYTNIAVFLFCAALLLIMSAPVSGRPFRLNNIPDKGKNFSCGTCHVNPRGGGTLTSFGNDYKKIGLKAGDKYTEELGAMDSDGDGFSNDREFAGGSHPGDPESKPNQ